jgi:hypothetical protein
MKRTYELMFIVRPDMPEEEQEQVDFYPGIIRLVFGGTVKAKCGASDGLLTRSAGSTTASFVR